MKVTVSIDIAAPIERVWAEAIDFASHAEWQNDAVSIEFETAQREGVGTVLLVESRLGPLHTLDRLIITELEKPHRIHALHGGSVSGSATWLLSESGVGTNFEWTEELRFPWFFGGPVGGVIAKPLLGLLWRQDLRNLKERMER
jgi:uncharacterized protein YndB with AHSA1/START domain